MSLTKRAESSFRMSAPPVNKARVHTANVRLVRVGLMEQTVVTNIPQYFWHSLSCSADPGPQAEKEQFYKKICLQQLK
jgi:hypothetical protein